MTSMATLEDIVARLGVTMAESQERTDRILADLAESRKETERVLREQAESRKETERVLREQAESRERAFREQAESRKETERVLREQAESRKETERVLREQAESRERAFKEQAESRERAFKEQAESRERAFKEQAESRKETERALKEQDDRLSARTAETSATLERWIGRFGDKIGYLIERILIPGIKPLMNELGHDFTRLGPDHEFYLGKRRFAEVDLFLENGDESMAVEVKTHLRKDDVEYHQKRLKLLRENEAVSGLRGKVLYAAMAGLDIDDDARDLALGLGMYVLEMVEETKYVRVIKPSVELGRW